MTLGAMLATVSTPVTALAAKAPPAPPEILEGGPWNMNYAEDSCRLARSFGEGKGQVQIMLEFFRPGGGYQLLLAGDRFATDQVRPKVKMAWGPDLGNPVELVMNAGKVDGTIPMLLGSGLPVTNGQSQLIENLTVWSTPSPAQEAAARELTVEFETKRTILKTGPMRAPLVAARTCLDELVTKWGLDPLQQQSVLTPPTPVGNPGEWFTSADYPTNPLRAGKQAIVHVRLIVGPDGKPESCAIQSATQGKPFADTSCRMYMQRARFNPALDKDGKAVRSYYISTIRWIVP